MTSGTVEGGASYRAAGVDIAAGERAVELMKASVATTTRPEVIGGLGGFAGLFRLDLDRWAKPVIAASTDGAGTKTAVAQALGRHDTIGQDLVAMVVDDLVVCGAEPLLVQDYVAVGRLEPETVADIVRGIADGCRISGATLLGGETAEHPGLMRPGEYDVAATAVGVVEADDILGPDRVRAGDAVVAMASSGLHCNGYSLVRHLLATSGADLATPFEGSTLGEVLLTPTRIYALDCLAAAAALPVRTFAHVTGGGLAGNLGRVVPGGLVAEVDRATWSPGAVYRWAAETGGVSRAEMERTFNQGVGMVTLVDATAASDLVALYAERGLTAWIAGSVRADEGAERARCLGAHPA
ncbi:MAG: phosphoribosylformylglycinamidine cyclo-ligase [Mycobacteriales bacterium]